MSNRRALLPPGAPAVHAAAREATRCNAVAGAEAFADGGVVAKLTTAAAAVAVLVVDTRVTSASSTTIRDWRPLLRRAATGPNGAPG
jgi:hypothetical protein